MRWLRHLSLSIAPLSIACLLLAAAPRGAVAGEDWVRSWIAPLQAIPQQASLGGEELPPFLQAPEIAGRTVRQIIYPTLGGAEIRLHISNRYSDAPLDILETRIARASGAGAAAEDAGVAVTFSGSRVLHLPPGGEADSDPVGLVSKSGQPYATSLYLGPDQRLEAWHRVSSVTNYVSGPGNHAGDLAADAYQTQFMHYAWITSLSVRQPAPATAILAIGDSITDGLRSTPDLSRGWPDGLMRRLAGDKGAPMAVLNAGISGNRLLSDSPCFGEKLTTRFEREIAGAADIKAAIVLIGINDINFATWPTHAGLDCGTPHNAQITAADLIAGYRQLAEAAHHRQIRLIMGTLLPAALPAEREKIRLAVNQWIRSTGEIDGVIDFDAAMRDPAHPENLRAGFDSGDHLHPSDPGYAEMAQAIPLQLFATPQIAATTTNLTTQ